MYQIHIDISYGAALDHVLEQASSAVSPEPQKFTFLYGLNCTDSKVIINILKTIYLLGANRLNAQFKAQHDLLCSQIATSPIQQQHVTYWSRLQSLVILTQGLNQLNRTSVVALLQGLQRDFGAEEVFKLPNEHVFSFKLFSLFVELYCRRYGIGEYYHSTEYDVAVALVEEFELQKIEAEYLVRINEVIAHLKILLPGRGEALGRALRRVLPIQTPRPKPTLAEFSVEITLLHERWLNAVNHAVAVRVNTLQSEGRAHRDDEKFAELFLLKGELDGIRDRRVSLSHKLGTTLQLITQKTTQGILSKRVQANLLTLIDEYHKKIKASVDQVVSLPVAPKPLLAADFARKIIDKVFIPSAKSCLADPRFATTIYSFKPDFWTSPELEPSMKIFFTVNALYHLGVSRINKNQRLEDSYQTLVDEKLRGFFILNYGLHQIHSAAIAELQRKLPRENAPETYTLPNLICLEGTDFLLNLIATYCNSNQLPTSVALHQALQNLQLPSASLAKVMPVNERTFFGAMQPITLVAPSVPAVSERSPSRVLSTPQLPTESAATPTVMLSAPPSLEIPLSPDLIARRKLWVKQPYALLKEFAPVCASGEHTAFFDEFQATVKQIVEGQRYLASDVTWVTKLYEALKLYVSDPVAIQIKYKKSTGVFSSTTRAFAQALTEILNLYPLT